MNDARVVEDIVTMFFLNTCRLRPKLSKPAREALVCCLQSASPLLIPLTTGSAAEFYIEPTIAHVGDIDVMFHGNNELAIPRGHPPPTQLPAEFDDYVKVYEIIDSHLPGYVYLELRYLLSECSDDGKYIAVEYEEQRYAFSSPDNGNVYVSMASGIHGPAILALQLQRWAELPLDAVPCLRCLVWPTQAADWPTRHRNYGWPDSATVDRVVSNGCDVVGAVHRQCRQHEEMSKFQRRLSFSRAEIVLINSWMPVQQIVYHMLRVFIKTERLTDSADDSKTLSNYHIKTLMLWACELKSHSWWTGELNLVRICVQLLHILGDWLTDARCQHYFISNCNLIDNDSSLNLTDVGGQLMSIDATWLSKWFVDNYIRKCSELCPSSISRVFDDVIPTTKLQNLVLAIIDWRSNTTLSDTLEGFYMVYSNITRFVSLYSLTALSTSYRLTELRKISTSLSVYFLSIAFLHVACRTSKSVLNDELMDVLAVLVGQSVGPRRYSSRRSSVLLLNKVVNLIEAVIRHGPRSRSILQLIEIELCKAYLYEAMNCKDSDIDSIYCLANVYLAVLYYTTGQYQMAIDHCTLVIRSQDHSQCSSHVVQREILPKTDDDIDTVLGLAVFYQHVRMTALNQQHQQHVTVFTTELFAHYLHMKCPSATKRQQLSDTTNSQSSTCEVQSYLKYVTDTQQLCISDVLLWKLVDGFSRPNFVCKQLSSNRQHPANYPNKLETSDLVELLLKSALDHLTRFRELVVREFGFAATTVTTDFEALYAYKRGDYQQCLQLSTQNVHTVGPHALLHDVYDSLFSTFPEFIQLLDDDIVSLTALTLIVNPKCRHDIITDVSISQLTLSLYLMTQCQLKLRHSVTSLAQTLDYIKGARRGHPVERTLDRLVLKMTAHKALMYMLK